MSAVATKPVGAHSSEPAARVVAAIAVGLVTGLLMLAAAAVGEAIYAEHYFAQPIGDGMLSEIDYLDTHRYKLLMLAVLGGPLAVGAFVGGWIARRRPGLVASFVGPLYVAIGVIPYAEELSGRPMYGLGARFFVGPVDLHPAAGFGLGDLRLVVFGLSLAVLGALPFTLGGAWLRLRRFPYAF